MFGDVDADDEIAAAGAFTETLDELRAAGLRLPLTADHEMTGAGVIGSADEVREDGRGLRVVFRSSSYERVQALRRKTREGHLNGLSIRPGSQGRPADDDR